MSEDEKLNDVMYTTMLYEMNHHIYVLAREQFEKLRGTASEEIAQQLVNGLEKLLNCFHKVA